MSAGSRWFVWLMPLPFQSGAIRYKVERRRLRAPTRHLPHQTPAPFFDRDFVRGPIESSFGAYCEIQCARIRAQNRLLFRTAQGYLDIPSIERRVGDNGRGIAGKTLSRPDGISVIGREANSPAVIHDIAR